MKKGLKTMVSLMISLILCFSVLMAHGFAYVYAGTLASIETTTTPTPTPTSTPALPTPTGTPTPTPTIIPHADVNIINPTDSSSFYASSVSLEVVVTPYNMVVGKVEYFDEDKLIGVVFQPVGGKYVYVWNNPPLGQHTIKVYAYDMYTPKGSDTVTFTLLGY